MVILSHYEIKFNPNHIFFVTSKDFPICPCCGEPLSGYDHHPRMVRLGCGIKVQLLVPRAFCRNCHRLHTELPDFIQPYKHYEAMAIQNVIDGKTLSTCSAEDSTIRRWQAEFRHSAPYVETMLRAVGHKKLPLFGGSLLEKLKKHIYRWLSFVTRMLISSGFSLPTCFAFTPSG